MKIGQFLGSLVPSFKKDDVAERIRAIREDLVSYTIPTYITAAEDFKKHPVKSKAMIDYENTFSKMVDRQNRQVGCFEATLHCLRNMQTNLDFIETLVEKSYSHDIVVAGITYKRAQILQYIAITGFVSEYARRVLLYLLACEANVEAKTLPDGKERPIPEINWLNANRSAFFRSLNVVSVKEKELSALIENIPDITVTSDNEDLTRETLGRHKVDPMNFHIIPIGLNPFHFFGVRWANRQVVKYQRAKEEKRAVEFRLEQLRSQRSGEPDPRLEKTISYYEGEVNKLSAKIAKMEE